MSRVAKNPVVVPAGVEIKIDAGQIVVKGPLGSLAQAVHPSVKVEQGEAGVQCSAIEGAVNGKAMSGTMRALVNNMVIGVTEGFERKLELVGVGYRATMQGKDLSLALGFSHPVVFTAPEGITLEAPTQTEIRVKGSDKQQVGEIAAKIRAVRPPEPYKGKGVRYAGEKILIKEAKKA